MLPITVRQLLCSCSPWWCRRCAAQLVTCRLLADGLDWFPPWHFHAHCWKFLPSETLFYDFGQLLHSWLPADNGCQQPTHFLSTRTMWSKLVYGIHLSLSMTAHHWRNRPATPYSAITYWVNVQLPLVPDMHNFLIATHLCLHVTIMTINNLWTALVNMFKHTLLFFTNIFSQSCDNHLGVLQQAYTPYFTVF